MDKRIKDAEKKIFRCTRCGKVIKGVRAVTEARREGCEECGGVYFEKDAESGDDYPLRGNHII
jgi:predicted  nucleic acid-binding Zn-ribbon protein